ncbi:MAG: 50S ribosomal protein L32e [Candidatus Aenigmatarchaeota archaeon]|nr:MAG: 50S ribosomal protein L32e [Candidatus Aenigmarchaeota archaeon]
MEKKMLTARKKKKARKPGFRRQEGYRHKRLGDAWRRPRGRHSKLRMGEKARGKKPSPGYSSPKAVKGLTSKGLRKVYVSNVEDLKGIDPNKEIAVIKSGVGKKKRMEIAAEASSMKVKVENAYRVKLPGR